MKNPNGYGCIRLMGGNRRRPYAFINTALSVALPISVTNILIAVTSNCDNNDAIATSICSFSGSSLYVHTWRGDGYANDVVAYIVIGI